MEKYIFLDIDGVIRIYSYDAYLVANRKKHRDKHGPFFDPTRVALLNKITDETGAKIVISSSWRWVGLKAMQECFTERGITGEVVDVTPLSTINNLYFERGEEIDKWLIDNGFPDKIAIIDDQELGEGYNEWTTFFKTKTKDGLTEELAQKIIEHLNS